MKSKQDSIKKHLKLYKILVAVIDVVVGMLV